MKKCFGNKKSNFVGHCVKEDSKKEEILQRPSCERRRESKETNNKTQLLEYCV